MNRSVVLEQARMWYLMIHKDLIREYRAPRAWQGMCLLGVALTMIICLQVDLPVGQKSRTIGAMFWLAAYFAGTVALDRSFSCERDEGCWHGLLQYPVMPATLFLAKLTVNFIALCCLDGVLVPAFVAFSDTPLLRQPLQFLAVLLLANVGFAAVGTLLSALVDGMQQRGNLLVLLLLPLVTPLVLGASRATSAPLVLERAVEWQGWTQLLAVFAFLFVSLGAMLFEFVIEE